jgi:hypothetical protein
MRTARPDELFGPVFGAIGDIGANAQSRLRYFALSLAFAGTLFVFVPFYPVFPVFSLDASWAYAMNEAVFRNMVFGRDVIFTFGPLASLSTHMYHPVTDSAMLAFTILFAPAFFAGCIVLCRGSYLILLLPLMVSKVGPGLYDPLFFVLPFVSLLVVTQKIPDEKKK